MEDEVREMLRVELAVDPDEPINLGERITARFPALGGVNLELPEGEAVRDAPMPAS